MSFFGKLKERLFKSSSKLGEGLDDLVAGGDAIEPSQATAGPEAQGADAGAKAAPAGGSAAPAPPPRSRPGVPAFYRA